MLGIFLQLLVSGIAMGFVYGLVGIEYTLIWNSTGLLNFAHERIIMLGAYVLAGTFVMQLGMAPLPGIVGVIIFITLFAIFGCPGRVYPFAQHEQNVRDYGHGDAG